VNVVRASASQFQRSGIKPLRLLGKTLRHIEIWDLPTRLFHWLLVIAVVGALATAPSCWVGRHMFAGCAVAGLLLFRAVWAFLRIRIQPAHELHLSAAPAGHYTGPQSQRRSYDPGPSPCSPCCWLLDSWSKGGMEKQGPLAPFVPYALGMAARSLHKLLALLPLLMIALLAREVLRIAS
jgi:hypothetical protein